MNWQLITAAFIGGFTFPIVSRLFKRFVMADRVEVEKAFDRPGVSAVSYWWRIKSRNGQIVATSETYDSVGNARKMGKRKAKQYGLGYKDHTKEEK